MSEDNTGMVDELDDEDKKMMTEASEEPAAPVEEKPAVEEKPVEASAEKPAGDDDESEDIVEMGEGVNKGRFIRHGAFHRERKMRQEVEKQAKEYQAQIERERIERARINERLELLMKAVTPPSQAEEAPKVPNPEEDPFAYMRYLEGRLNALGETTDHVTQEQESTRQYQTAQAAFMQDASRFAQQTPDFMNAYDHLMKSRDRELQMIGQSDPRQRNQIIREEEFMIVAEAFRQGRSPAELFYALATDRGYRKPEVAAPAEAPAAAAPAAAQPKPSAVDQVKQVAAAQQTAKSLSSASGSASNPPTAQSLADMSEDEFIELYNKMPREQRRQYFGG